MLLTPDHNLRLRVVKTMAKQKISLRVIEMHLRSRNVKKLNETLIIRLLLVSVRFVINTFLRCSTSRMVTAGAEFDLCGSDKATSCGLFKTLHQCLATSISRCLIVILSAFRFYHRFASNRDVSLEFIENPQIRLQLKDQNPLDKTLRIKFLHGYYCAVVSYLVCPADVQLGICLPIISRTYNIPVTNLLK